MKHFQFQYDLGKKKHIIVAFDVVKNAGNTPVFQNITLTPNYHDSFLLNLKPDLQLVYDDNAKEYVFRQGYSFTNGDYRQIIMRMLKLAEA